MKYNRKPVHWAHPWFLMGGVIAGLLILFAILSVILGLSILLNKTNVINIFMLIYLYGGMPIAAFGGAYVGHLLFQKFIGPSIWSSDQSSAEQFRNSCVNCGYDIREQSDHRCPECGTLHQDLVIRNTPIEVVSGHEGTKSLIHAIVSERLRLREPRPSDIDALGPVLSDDRVLEFLGDGVPHTPELLAKSLQRRIQLLAERNFTLWTVELQDSNRIIGDCGFIPADWQGPELELIYRLHPDTWGKGYATEAAQAALEDLWSRTSITSVIALIDKHHTASRHIAKKLGFLEHGQRPGKPGILEYRMARPS